MRSFSDRVSSFAIITYCLWNSQIAVNKETALWTVSLFTAQLIDDIEQQAFFVLQLILLQP